jgi:hypothetical protein
MQTAVRASDASNTEIHLVRISVFEQITNAQAKCSVLDYQRCLRESNIVSEAKAFAGEQSHCDRDRCAQ